MEIQESYSEHLQLVLKADRDPICSRLRPLEVVNRAVCCVVKLWTFHTILSLSCVDWCARYLLRGRILINTPNQSLRIISCRTYMGRTLRRPSYRIDLCGVTLKSLHSLHGVSEIKDHDIVTVLLDASQVEHILFIPSNA